MYSCSTRSLWSSRSPGGLEPPPSPCSCQATLVVGPPWSLACASLTCARRGCQGHPRDATSAEDDWTLARPLPQGTGGEPQKRQPPPRRAGAGGVAAAADQPRSERHRDVCTRDGWVEAGRAPLAQAAAHAGDRGNGMTSHAGESPLSEGAVNGGGGWWMARRTAVAVLFSVRGAVAGDHSFLTRAPALVLAATDDMGAQRAQNSDLSRAAPTRLRFRAGARQLRNKSPFRSGVGFEIWTRRFSRARKTGRPPHSSMNGPSSTRRVGPTGEPRRPAPVFQWETRENGVALRAPTAAAVAPRQPTGAWRARPAGVPAPRPRGRHRPPPLVRDRNGGHAGGCAKRGASATRSRGGGAHLASGDLARASGGARGAPGHVPLSSRVCTGCGRAAGVASARVCA